MGTATLTTDGSSVGNIVTPIEITEGQGARLFAWAAHPAVYGYPVVTGQDEDGNDVTRDPTPAEVQMRWWEKTLEGTFNNVVRHEEKLAKEALAAPEEIVASPGTASYTPPV